ncbi:coatomer subunit beta-like [Tropilaelaps mercedesae]|uniref:Coatomer subunit beta n=1 Tax=Tropilaelaps mercedesae TaxID=418985 RepID=A0A1V9Y1K4_9ACAR|nr:coatomer subunit beta-like [Tropilaelaps mercedesae]
MEDGCFTLAAPLEDGDVQEMSIRTDFEKCDPKRQAKALEQLINKMLHGEKFSSAMLMSVIRFLLPSSDHAIKKLLLIYWEIVPKRDSNGKLLQEMILVCDAYRKDLQHPNEFIRGSTLRFLCKLQEPELLEPLIPAMTACLQHRHSYVRKNAVLAILQVYRNFSQLIPDAPDLVAECLEIEHDQSSRRNAFLALQMLDSARALRYLAEIADQVERLNEPLQLIIIKFIYEICHAQPSERGKFIKMVYSLLNSTSPSVKFEAAGVLVTLSQAPAAIRAAAGAYIDLVVRSGDNNVKLIVLDNLISMKDEHGKLLQDIVMDLFRVLGASDLEVRRKALRLALDLVNAKYAPEMVGALGKEIAKSEGAAAGNTDERYRELLVKTLHRLAIKYPDLMQEIAPIVLDLLSDSNESVADAVLTFAREVLHKFEPARSLIVSRLIDVFPLINHDASTHRSALWLLGEYCSTTEQILAFIECVKGGIGDLPLVETEQEGSKDGEDAERDKDGKVNGSADVPVAVTRVTADGTYATQTALTVETKIDKDKKRPALRQYMFDGDFFVAAALASDLVKASLRFVQLVHEPKAQNMFIAESMLILTSIMHYGQSGLPKKPISEDDVKKMSMCLKVLMKNLRNDQLDLVGQTREALDHMLAIKSDQDSRFEEKSIARDSNATKKDATIGVDDSITFGLLTPKGGASSQKENIFETSLAHAVQGSRDVSTGDLLKHSKLSKVTQLTGLCDPVYAEAYVHATEFDISLDVLVVNQTSDMLQNCLLELATLGDDLKLLQKPTSVTLAPFDFCSMKATIKVAAADNGTIFGNIVYDVKGTTNVVVLNDIKIDIIDYIMPSVCSDEDFRKMWAEFEWENKVSVNTSLWDLNEYLQSLINATNMACLTPERALQGDCGFLAANLYAKSIFGEHAVANVSIERHSSTTQPQTGHSHISGHIRIRAKSQGMAICIGEKMNHVQRQATPVITQAAPQQQHASNAQTQQMPVLVQASA